MTTSAKKDTIYVDIDDEITSIIDKVQTSSSKIVALVLPKRAAMLQSSVNMKLLKKAAADSGKNIVLITTEGGLLSLAAASGVHVAKNLQSKPEIPAEEGIDQDDQLDNSLVSSEEVDAAEFDPTSSGEKPIGKLAGLDEDDDTDAVPSQRAKPELAPMPFPSAIADSSETIELDNSDKPDKTEKADDNKSKKDKKADKKLKVPNFERFRLRVILGAVLLIILIVGFIIANIVLPKATITVDTTSSNVSANLTLNLQTAAKTVSLSQNIIPTQIQQTQKSNSQQVNTTGQQNEGTQATGSVTMTAGSCTGTQPSDVVAGTGLSTNNLTFITNSDASFTPVVSHGKCSWQGQTSQGNSSIGITAQTGGSNFNTPSGTTWTFSVAGRSDVDASGSASGGTDNIIQTVTQTDLNNAQQKITMPSNSSVESALETSLSQAGLYPLPATFNVGSPNTTYSANVGDQQTTVTATEAITYTMFGAKQADLKTALDNNIDQQINTSKQMILDDGLSQATIGVLNQTSSTAQITLQTTAVAAPNLNLTSLKQQVVGKKTGDIESIISSNPGVTKVTVHYSPFWVSSAPSKTSKISIVIKKSS